MIQTLAIESALEVLKRTPEQAVYDTSNRAKTLPPAGEVVLTCRAGIANE
jgi:hypothetical protein